jgi:hypothetical protein
MRVSLLVVDVSWYQTSPGESPIRAVCFAECAGQGICDNEGVARARELEAHLSRCEGQLRLFQKVSRLVAKATSLREALDSIAGQVTEYLHADSCLLYLISGDELVLCAARGASPAAAVGHVRLRLSEGLTGWVARERSGGWWPSRVKRFRIRGSSFSGSCPRTVTKRSSRLL